MNEGGKGDEDDNGADVDKVGKTDDASREY